MHSVERIENIPGLYSQPRANSSPPGRPGLASRASTVLREAMDGQTAPTAASSSSPRSSGSLSNRGKPLFGGTYFPNEVPGSPLMIKTGLLLACFLVTSLGFP